MSVWIWYVMHALCAIICIAGFIWFYHKGKTMVMTVCAFLCVILSITLITSSYTRLFFDKGCGSSGIARTYEEPGCYSRCYLSVKTRNVGIVGYIKGLWDYTEYAEASYRGVNDSVLPKGISIVKIREGTRNCRYWLVGDKLFMLDDYICNNIKDGKRYKILYDKDSASINPEYYGNRVAYKRVVIQDLDYEDD